MAKRYTAQQIEKFAAEHDGTVTAVAEDDASFRVEFPTWPRSHAFLDEMVCRYQDPSRVEFDGGGTTGLAVILTQ